MATELLESLLQKAAPAFEMLRPFLHVEGVPVWHLVIEGLLLLAIIKLIFFSKKYRVERKSEKLTTAEEDELIASWVPEPLVKPVTTPAVQPPVLTGPAGPVVTLTSGKKAVNLAGLNFLGLLGHPAMAQAAEATARKYGIGSCGPRGFYGTLDVHLELERSAAKFMGVEEAILYSYGFSTIASVIPAYAKRGDVIFYDRACCVAIQQGLIASRARLVPYDHCDMASLERALEAQAAADARDPSKAAATKRFIVSEGLFLETGRVVPLRELVALKYKYRARIFLDESCSFGVLGAHGRGVTEHFTVPVDEIDAIAVALGTSVASEGGLVFGAHYVIDHQRLSGLGYCYSASLPPLLAAAATVALTLVDAEASARQATLQARAAQLRAAVAARVPGLVLTAAIAADATTADALSPIVVATLAQDPPRAVDEELATLAAFAAAAQRHGAVVAVAAPAVRGELHPRRPAVRLAVSAGHTQADITAAVRALELAAKETL